MFSDFSLVLAFFFRTSVDISKQHMPFVFTCKAAVLFNVYFSSMVGGVKGRHFLHFVELLDAHHDMNRLQDVKGKYLFRKGSAVVLQR